MNTSPSSDQKERLKSALIAMRELRAKLTSLEQAQTEPLAVVGMGCRFPGNVNSPEMFWSLLRRGIDATTGVPAERGWDLANLYSDDPDQPGKLYVSKGGFLRNVDQFDAAFFGIPPREAIHLDPQQRLLLEVGWEAIEHAGLQPEKLRGSRTGVFIGITVNDYLQLQTRAGDLTAIDAYSTTGNHLNAAAGRLSYTLGLQGPSMAVDTACSSSLVTVHLACQSLRQRECDLALAGGVNLALSPDGFVATSRARMLARDGRCKTFDAEADGFARGEGCGLVVLKRLSDAIAQGDPILALIRGSAVNQDGPSSGLTVPNGPAQQAVIRQALANSGVQAEQISYVEAHGTGTALGDPIEIEALAAELCRNRSTEQPLFVGAAKTNLGHLESAAGIAGLIKLVLSLQHQTLPPHLNFNQPNPHIPWARLPIAIPTQLTPWPADNQPRRAGLSGFGVSGTNAHIVVEEATSQPLAAAEVDRPLHLLTLSAKSETALRQLASRYELYLLTHTDTNLADLCFTANTTRARFKHRLSAVASSAEQLSQQLADFSAGQASPELWCGTESQLPKVAFLFTGEGSQLVQQGRQLYASQPTFRQVLLDCEEILRSRLSIPLLAILYPTSPEQARLIDQPAYAQPALFAVEYALSQLWQSWGVQPDWVFGQGVGEYAAACAAGLYSLEAGLLLAAERGQLMQQSAENAAEAMLAFERRAAEIGYRPLQRGLVSSLTGQIASDQEFSQRQYWSQQLQSSASLEVAMETLQRQGCQIFVEVGPDPNLINQGNNHLGLAGSWLPSLRSGQPDWTTLLESAAVLNTQGVEIDWRGFDRDYPRQRLSLPTYPFQRQRFWVELPTRLPAEATSAAELLSQATTDNSTDLEAQDLEQRVLSLTAKITGLQPSQIGLTQTLEGELGLDSIMLTQLMNGLMKLIPTAAQQAFQQEVSLRDLLQLPHLQAVIELLEPWQGQSEPEPLPASLSPIIETSIETTDAQPVELLHGQYFHLIGHWLVNSNSLFATVRLEGPFDLEIAQQSWQDLIERHPMLRSRFHIPPQAERFRDFRLEVLTQPSLPEIAFTDLRPLSPEAQASSLVEERQRCLNYAWSLTQWPLHEFSVMQLQDSVYQLFLGNEHIISDGLGNHIILHEFLELYHARCQGQVPDLPEATSLADYAATVTAMNAAPEPSANQALNEYIHQQGQTTYSWNPDSQPFRFALPQYHSQPYQLDRRITTQLIARTREWRLPLNTLLTGAFLRALSQCDRESAQMILQMPTGGRVYPQVDASTQVSSFAQNLALSFERVQPEESWECLLQRVQQAIQGPLTSGLDRAQTYKMGLTFRDHLPLESGQVPSYSLSIFHEAIKSNVYLPYTGHLPLQTQYGPLSVTDYQAGGINAAGILDVLQEIFDDRLHLFASYDSSFFAAASIDQLMQAYQAELRALAEVSPPTVAPQMEEPIDGEIAALLQQVAADICHTPIGLQDLNLDLEADLGFDSLERIRIVTQLEKQWGSVNRKALLSCRSLQEMGQSLQATTAVVG
ncbi:acyltransferase domain-containing protein [Romeria aff. gracilis LEGE 07310]|uniref:Acyltransferase domain-containing protein n=1 Tax=Vasconcelosia minhoensis LEGE 07310 TaxID=915328 RepID=A0A8J7AAZ2_9CYAN|nr:type I polyketide synthase [Romeria gracilis]MBE9077336.1 acyltransferase domain-containing protein [Romeria aff. gracilis LEGE 07310]